MHQEIMNSLPPAPEKAVLSTSLGYAARDEYTHQDDWYLYRVVDTLHWRSQTGSGFGRILHTSAASNEGALPGAEGEARFSSPFNAAHFFGPLSEMVEGVTLDEYVLTLIDNKLQQAMINCPGADASVDNVIVVGSSYRSGVEHPTSSRGSEVRAVGTDLHTPCVVQDRVCDGSVAFYPQGGTSLATPQVAGLAAYLWNLKPDATSNELREIIKHTYDNGSTSGLIDAYLAVLALDSRQFHPVRLEILDVAGPTPAIGKNQQFDENDIELYLNQFLSYEEQRTNVSGDPDYSRYDLNGDGYTGGSGRQYAAKFDLTVDNPPLFSTFDLPVEGSTVSFNEVNLTDYEVLCYHAYSDDFFTGSPERRSALLGNICRSLPYRYCYVNFSVAGNIQHVMPASNWEQVERFARVATAEGHFTGNDVAGYEFSGSWDKSEFGKRSQGTIELSLEGTMDNIFDMVVKEVTMTITENTLSQDYNETSEISFTGEDIPVIWEYYPYDFEFYVHGAETCAHITDLEYFYEYSFPGYSYTKTLLDHSCSYSFDKIDVIFWVDAP
jgi:hypothetical protein